MAKNLKAGPRVGPAGRALERVLAAKMGQPAFEAEQAKSGASLLILRAMEEAGVSRAELARRLGSDNARVTRLLDGEQNLTLATLAETLCALGYRLELAAKLLRAKRSRQALPECVSVLAADGTLVDLTRGTPEYAEWERTGEPPSALTEKARRINERGLAKTDYGRKKLGLDPAGARRRAKGG